MNFTVVLIGTFFALFSSIILAYVSMATGAGPWIAPTLVLMASVLLKMRQKVQKPEEINRDLALIQSIGAVGGIVAVGIGFTLPMLYFLDKEIFDSWVQAPFKFCSLITVVCIVGGGFGIYLARMFSEKLIIKENLNFPVSRLTYRMITTQSQGKQLKDMLVGFFSTAFFCFIRDGFLGFRGFLPKTFFLFRSVLGNKFALSLFLGPTLWAVGFISGAVITIPLLVGMLSKYFIIYPINNHATYLPWCFFLPLEGDFFTTAFCAGIALTEALFGVVRYPSIIWNSIKAYFVNKRGMAEGVRPDFEDMPPQKAMIVTVNKVITKIKNNSYLGLEAVLVIFAAVLLLSFFKFTLPTQIFVLILTVIATYQISWLGGKIGLIPFGRFATFIMLPTMILFKLDYIQLTLLCVFFNVCAAGASDLLFDYKVGQLCGISFSKIHRCQWIGLVAASCGMGIFFWLLFYSFQIGSPDLFAYRGMARALLIKSLSFDWRVVVIGGIYSVLIRQFKINPILTLSGILMPNNLSIGLIIGGLSSLFVRKVWKTDPEEYSSFWSGVFASEALWILFGMLLKILKF